MVRLEGTDGYGIVQRARLCDGRIAYHRSIPRLRIFRSPISKARYAIPYHCGTHIIQKAPKTTNHALPPPSGNVSSPPFADCVGISTSFGCVKVFSSGRPVCGISAASCRCFTSVMIVNQCFPDSYKPLERTNMCCHLVIKCQLFQTNI